MAATIATVIVGVEPMSGGMAPAAATSAALPATTADLSLVTSATPNPVLAGNTVRYTLTARNLGPTAAANTRVGGTLPAGSVLVRVTTTKGTCPTAPPVGRRGVVVCDIGTLGVKATNNVAVVTLVVQAVALQGSLESSMKVLSDTIDSSPANNGSTLSTPIHPRKSNLSITMAGPATAQVGSNVSYSMKVRNAGPNGVLSPKVVDHLPTGATFVGITTGGATCRTPAVGATGDVSCRLASVRVGGASPAITVTVKFPAGSVAHNVAVVRARATDDAPDNNKAEIKTLVGGGNPGLASDLAVRITGLTPVVSPGEDLTYMLAVANAGPATATDVSVAAEIPDGTTFVKADPPAGTTCTATGDEVRCDTAANLGVADAFSIPFTVHVDQATEPLIVAATVNQAPTTEDVHPLDTVVTLGTPIVTPITDPVIVTGTIPAAFSGADLRVFETPIKDPSGIVVAAVTLLNGGTQNAHNVVVKTKFAQGTTINGNSTRWTLGSAAIDASAAPTLTWTVPDLPPNVGSTMFIATFVDSATVRDHGLEIDLGTLMEGQRPGEGSSVGGIVELASSVSVATSDTFDTNRFNNTGYIVMAPYIITPATVATKEDCEKNWGKFGVLLGGKDCESPTASLMGGVASFAAFVGAATGIAVLEQIVYVTVLAVYIAVESAVLV